MPGEPSAAETVTRCGFAALIGAPNAGKSTLINQLVGGKISIVSHKVQTTRSRIRAIAIEGDSQIVIVDTPGIFTPRRKLDEAMVQAAWASAGEADVIVVVVDSCRGRDDEVDRVLAGTADARAPVLLALNKVDAIARPALLALAADMSDATRFEAVFMISALDGDGVDDLKRELGRRMPVGPWLYPEDQIADVPLRLLAAEITREKVFNRLHDELPYHSTVETEKWTEGKDGSVRIEQVIYVQRPGQKKIVLGAGGRTIKSIGQEARKELQEMLGTRVHLFLFVKVRSDWSEDPERYLQMGLQLPGRGRA